MVKKSAEKGTQKIMQSHVQIFVRERKKRMHTERERERVKYTFKNTSEKNLSRE